MKTALSFAVAVMLICSASMAGATTYSGSLSSPDGLTGGLRGTGGTGGTPAGWFPISISWQVTQNLDNSWNYHYVLETTRRNISHFIVEVSDNFTMDDIFNISTSPALTAPNLNTHDPGGGNPNMPGSLFGLKFDGIGEASTWTITFDSWRVPVWGDFYAKDGVSSADDNTVWNEGFGLFLDPALYPAQDGSLFNKLLVPDTHTTPIPEPMSMTLAGLGLAGVAAARRRKNS